MGVHRSIRYPVDGELERNKDGILSFGRHMLSRSHASPRGDVMMQEDYKTIGVPGT